MKQEPIILERTFNAPITKVWRALTESDEMKKWYFDLPGFKAEVGYEFEFLGGKDERKPFRHLCKVIEAVSGKKLTYSWRYDGYPGTSFVTFELFKEGDKTRLQLTHKDLETLTGGHPDLVKENFVKGWTDIIHTSLKNYLEPANN
jgi:uncharacterized protein YndB with AHSA1/START domain